MTLTLGIDQAIRGVAGFALVNPDHPSEQFVWCGIWQAPNNAPLETRIDLFAEEVARILRQNGMVQVVAVEDVYLGHNNPQTMRVLALAAGAALGVAAAYNRRGVLVKHHDTDGVKETLPHFGWFVKGVERKHRIHVEDATAIAWHGAGVAAQAARLLGEGV